MVTLFQAVGLERITLKYIYFNVCDNDRGSRTSYDRSSLAHCTCVGAHLGCRAPCNGHQLALGHRNIFTSANAAKTPPALPTDTRKMVKLKVKFTLEQATNAQGWNRGIDLLCL
jgi:hypothetical protein